MQVTGTFPALSDGMKKSAPKPRLPKPPSMRMPKPEPIEDEEEPAVRKVAKSFPRKPAASKKPAGRPKKSPMQAMEEAAEAGPSGMPGMGSVRRAPRPINAPKTLIGRRNQSHLKARG